jgi:hypothetical protein
VVDQVLVEQVYEAGRPNKSARRSGQLSPHRTSQRVGAADQVPALIRQRSELSGANPAPITARHIVTTPRLNVHTLHKTCPQLPRKYGRPLSGRPQRRSLNSISYIEKDGTTHHIERMYHVRWEVTQVYSGRSHAVYDRAPDRLAGPATRFH